MVLKLIKTCVQRRMFSTQTVKTKIGLLGVPYNEGTTRANGSELGPRLIRESGFIKEIQDFNENVDIKDFGDLTMANDEKDALKSTPENMNNYRGFMPLMKRISDKVQEIRAENRICITLGGDHALAVGNIWKYIRHLFRALDKSTFFVIIHFLQMPDDFFSQNYMASV